MHNYNENYSLRGMTMNLILAILALTILSFLVINELNNRKKFVSSFILKVFFGVLLISVVFLIILLFPNQYGGHFLIEEF